MLKSLFGTRLEKAEIAYTRHERKYHELMSKAELYRTFNKFEMAAAREKQAESHYNMMVTLSNMIENLKSEE